MDKIKGNAYLSKRLILLEYNLVKYNTNAIELERRKELFMEGHRWLDLKRTTRSINRGEIFAPTTQSVLAPNSRSWVWPIPQAERDANPNMSQNAGY